MLFMVLEPEKLHLGNNTLIFLLEPWLDLETYSWFTTNLVMVTISHLEVNDTLQRSYVLV
jgi:hypothetical protein